MAPQGGHFPRAQSRVLGKWETKVAKGHNTYWIIVSIPDGKALTPLNDKRAAMHFVTAEAAQAWLAKMPGHDPSFEIVVEVPA